MKMKRLLAFVLAGTLSLSNITWAAADVTKTEAKAEETEETITASSSNATVETVNTDEQLNDNAGQAEGEEWVTWVEDEQTTQTIYCGQMFTAKVNNQSEKPLPSIIQVTSPGEDGAIGSKTEIKGDFIEPGELYIKIPGGVFKKSGNYELCFVSEDGDAYSASFTVTVKKIPSMTVEFSEKIFNETYYSADLPQIDRIELWDINITEAERVEADEIKASLDYLTNVKAVCEKKDGVYVITKMTSDQCDDITVVDTEDGYARPDVREATVESIKFLKESVNVYSNSSYKLEVAVTPDGAGEEAAILWKSSDTTIASVSSSGIVYGHKEGTATITASLEDKEAVCTVVVKKAVESISLDVTKLDMNPGKTYQFKPIILPADIAADAVNDIEWTSSNEKVATVDEKGVVTAHETGYANISARLGGKYSASSCQIHVKAPYNLKASVLADGTEKVLNLSDKDLFFKEDDGVKSVKLKELPEETKKYFDVAPVVSGTTIRFKLKASGEAFQVEIPMSIDSENYPEYNNDCVLTVSSLPVVKVTERTEDEIRGFFNAHPFSTAGTDSWEITPNPSREIAGKLKEESVTNALNALNFVRYIAGIPSDVTNSEEYEEAAQAGTTLLQRINKGLDHRPAKPAGVSDEFYNLGYKGTRHSNLGAGYANLAQGVIGGWMEDGDESNIADIGHRRWCLNPPMGATGFGHSGTYTAMYSLDDSNIEQTPDYAYVPWPGQTMPVSYFYGPWSIALDHDIYDYRKTDDIKITMTNEGTGQQYVMDKSTTDMSGRYFHVSTGSYGSGWDIVFKPGVSFKSGDRVSVNITGLKDRYGNGLSIDYSVKFFSMKVNALESIRLNTTSTSLTVDSTYQLRASMVPSDATNASLDDVKWSSSDEAIADVDDEGLVTAVAVGTARITAELNGKTATCTITVRRTGSSGSSGGGSGSSSGGGGSSSGGGGGGGSSSGKGSSGSGGPAGGNTSQPGAGQSGPLPDYVVTGNWTQANGTWQFTDASGQPYRSKWAAVSNPYANIAAGQANFDWFFFDAAGNMMTGWYLDVDGSYYYLNPASDGTRGKMMTGWVWIPDASGVNRCYYLNPNSDGTRGKMLNNTVVEGYTLNAEGQWVVNGVVQTK